MSIWSTARPDHRLPMKKLPGLETGFRAGIRFGRYGSERPEGKSFGLSLHEMRHGLSQGLVNLATFGWEAHGEPPAALVFLCVKDAGKAMRFPSPQASFGANPPLQAHQGRGDLSLAIRAWFRMAGLAATVWIPAFAGMAEREAGMAEREAGMAEREAGMAGREAGMAGREAGITAR